MWFVAKVPDHYAAHEVAAGAGPAGGVGRCRRHAPTMGGYPVVFGHDWCGDHRLDENALTPNRDGPIRSYVDETGA